MPYRKAPAYRSIKPPVGAQQDYGHPIARGLISHWLLGDGAGPWTADLLAPRESASNMDTGASWTSGKFGKAVALNGTSSTGVYFRRNNLNPAAVTVSCWAMMTTFGASYTTVYNKGILSPLAYHGLLVKSTGKIAIYVYGSADISYDGTGAITLVTNTWYHLAFTYSSATGLVVYINGVVDATVAANGALATNAGVSSIGIDLNNPGREMTGTAESVRVYNRALTPTEIRFLYNYPFADVLTPRRRIINSSAVARRSRLTTLGVY